MMLSDENSIFLNVVNTSSPLFFDDADLTIQRTAKSAEAACVGNNLNITPVLDVCTTSFTAIGVLAAAQRKHNNQHPPKRLEVAFFATVQRKPSTQRSAPLLLPNCSNTPSKCTTHHQSPPAFL
jgi:hypothetical protein